MPIKKFFLVSTLLLVYLTISLACDPLAFRLVGLFGAVIGGSAFLYPALYTILDIITRLIGRMLTIYLVFILHFCDFLYTYLLYAINSLPTVSSFHSLHAFNVVVGPLPRMFWAGVIGAIIASIVEIIIYSYFQKRMKSFFITSWISTIIILLAHNVPTEYIAFKKIFPHQWHYILMANFTAGIVLLTVYTFFGAQIVKFMETNLKKKRLELL